MFMFTSYVSERKVMLNLQAFRVQALWLDTPSNSWVSCFRCSSHCVVWVFQPLECTPVITYTRGRRDRETKLLMRGDCFGRIAIWEIPRINENKMKLVRQESFDNLPGNSHNTCLLSVKAIIYTQFNYCALVQITF